MSIASTSAGAGDRAAGEVGVGAVVERVGAEQHQQLEPTFGSAPQRGEAVVVGVRRSQTDREGTDDVAATQRGQDSGAGAAIEDGLECSDCGLGRLGQVRTTGDHDDVAAGDLFGDVGIRVGALATAACCEPGS